MCAATRKAKETIYMGVKRRSTADPLLYDGEKVARLLEPGRTNEKGPDYQGSTRVHRQ